MNDSIDTGGQGWAWQADAWTGQDFTGRGRACQQPESCLVNYTTSLSVEFCCVCAVDAVDGNTQGCFFA